MREDDVRAGLLRRRLVLADRAIDLDVANSLIAQLLLLESEDSDAEIRILVNARTGDLAPGLGLHDVIRRLRSPVSTFCVGEAGGVAALLLASGRRGARLALPGARVRLALESASVSGDLAELTARTKELGSLAERLARALAEATGRHFEEVEHDLERVLLLDAEAAVRYGIIDAVVQGDAQSP